MKLIWKKKQRPAKAPRRGRILGILEYGLVGVVLVVFLPTIVLIADKALAL